MTDLERVTKAGGLTKYDPVRGVLSIHAAREAEKRAKRARDMAAVAEAYRRKLEAQAELILWWDTEAARVQAGGDRKSKSPRGDFDLLRPEDLGLSKRILSKWRANLNDPDKFERTYAAGLERTRRQLEFDPADPHVSNNSGENEWYTPAEYLEAARAVLGAIDLDPASSAAANEVVKAERYFSIVDNGLEQAWAGRVFLNPPYAQPLVSHFCDRLAASVEAGTVTAAIVLVNNATDTAWFHRLASVAAVVCFPMGRIRFWGPDNSGNGPLQGQAFLYCGPDGERFGDVFGTFGIIASVRHA